FRGQWNMKSFIDEQVDAIRKQVKDQKVLVALSGGVDSSVVAVLIHRAIGDQLTCMFVDHGLLRKGEVESVVETFSGHFQIPFVTVDERTQYLTKRARVKEPNKKRLIIGISFILIFEE